jgi:hypothetical protein
LPIGDEAGAQKESLDLRSGALTNGTVHFIIKEFWNGKTAPKKFVLTVVFNVLVGLGRAQARTGLVFLTKPVAPHFLRKKAVRLVLKKDFSKLNNIPKSSFISLP